MPRNVEGNVRTAPRTETIATRISERKDALLDVLRIDLAERMGDESFKATRGRILEYAIDRLLNDEGLIAEEEIR